MKFDVIEVSAGVLVMVGNSDVGSRLFRGARVRMGQLGRDQHPKYGFREGVIVGRGSPSSWRVKFDEHTTIQAIHRDYLELALSRHVLPYRTFASSKCKRPVSTVIGNASSIREVLPDQPV